jgi:PTH1 family peptidyl-tRNA hydrolase
VRLKKGGGPGGHNGVRDTIRHCGNDFMRLRLGVGHPGTKDKVTGYVLKQGPADVEAAVTQAIVDAIAVLPLLAERGLGIAMNRLHTRPNDDDNNGSSKNGD